MDEQKFSIGELALCWYPKERELEMFWCKILHIGDEYASCELYDCDDAPTKDMKPYRIVTDVCVADISKP